MSRRTHFLAIAGLLALAGCASKKPTMREAGVPVRLDVAARALHEGRFPEAQEALVRVRESCGDEPLGHQALLLLGAAALDPRNPERDANLGALLLARAMRLPEAFPWTRPLAESLYLLALEFGAAVPDLATVEPVDGSVAARALPAAWIEDDEQRERCQPGERNATEAAAGPLPLLAGPNVLERVEQAEAEGEAQGAQGSARLRRQLAAVQRELADQRRELERVRATVRP